MTSENLLAAMKKKIPSKLSALEWCTLHSAPDLQKKICTELADLYNRIAELEGRVAELNAKV